MPEGTALGGVAIGSMAVAVCGVGFGTGASAESVVVVGRGASVKGVGKTCQWGVEGQHKATVLKIIKIRQRGPKAFRSLPCC